MKKNKIILTLLFVCLLLAAILAKVFIKQPIVNVQTTTFKQEYEELNDNDKYIDVEIPSDNPIVYSSYDEIEDIITEGTGVIYFGFPECPWCRNAVPQLIEAAKEVGLDKIYYFNALEIRDIKELDENGNIITEKDGTEEYYKLISLLYDHLEEYDGLNDKTIKRLYFPTVTVVKNGEVIGNHIGTVDSQDDPSIPLNESQIEELKGIYSNYMLEMLGTVCDTDIKDKC